MLRFFKSSLPARLLVLLVLVLGLSLPLLWLGLPLTPIEVRGLLVGEQIHHGALPYRDLYDGTAPLAATLFGLLDVVYSRPVLLYRLLALGLLLLQALRLNQVFNRADVHPERGYVAALTYLLVGSFSTDLDALSPLLVGHTFIVVALSALLPSSREGYDNRRLFRAGFLIGLAALCYLPLALFLALALFAVIIFAANAFRSYLLLLCGFFFPYALVATFFLYTGALPAFAQLHLAPGLNDLSTRAVNLPVLLQLRLLALPAVLLGLALLRTFSTTLGPVFQTKFRQLMLVWLLVAASTAAVGNGIATGSLVLVLPPLAYFGLFLWQKSRYDWALELLLLALLVVTAMLRYRAFVPGLESALHLPAESQYSLRPDPRYAALRGQPLLVLGADPRAYLTARPTTPYLDWQLSQVDFGHLDQYAAVVHLAQNIPVPPRFLLDQTGLLPRLQQQLPQVFGRYRLTATAQLYEWH